MTLSEIKNLEDRYPGFRLIKLELHDNRLFGSISYDFIDFNDKSDEIYTTIIIGPNGTRKSLLFRTIIELFRFLHEKKEKTDNITNRLQGGGAFNLTYSLNGLIYSFSNIKLTEEGEQKITEDNRVKTTNAFVSINGVIKDFSHVELPIGILASSMMINDKYPFISNEGFEQYKYLGVRNTPQTSSTQSQIRQTVTYIVNAVESTSFINSINKIVTEFLEINHSPYVVYKTQNTPKFFWGELNEEKLDSYFLDIELRYKEKDTIPPFKLKHFQNNIKNNENYKSKIIKFCNQLHEENRLILIPKSQSKILRFDISNQSDIENLKMEFIMIEELRKLGMLTAPEIDFVKKTRTDTDLTITEEESYHVSESSSGEFNILTSLIAIMAKINTHSLVFIDEPEVSLHPNWQMKYIHFLRKLFSSEAYKTCHIIIATHSHFLISDLPGDYSKIISLSKVDGVLKNISSYEGLNTFGWSAEEVLLKIFNVPTTRNFYVADSIGGILELLSKERRDEIEIKKQVKQLKNQNILELSENDPLHSIWKKIVSKYG